MILSHQKQKYYKIKKNEMWISLGFNVEWLNQKKKKKYVKWGKRNDICCSPKSLIPKKKKKKTNTTDFVRVRKC